MNAYGMTKQFVTKLILARRPSSKRFTFGVLTLFLLLCSSAVTHLPIVRGEERVQEQGAGKATAVNTSLTAQPQVVIYRNANEIGTGDALFSVQLTTAQGSPLVNQELLLSASVLPEQRVPTDLNGVSIFHLPTTLSEGSYNLKVIYTGSPGLHSAIAVATLYVMPPLPRVPKVEPVVAEPVTSVRHTVVSTGTNTVTNTNSVTNPGNFAATIVSRLLGGLRLNSVLPPLVTLPQQQKAQQQIVLQPSAGNAIPTPTVDAMAAMAEQAQQASSANLLVTQLVATTVAQPAQPPVQQQVGAEQLIISAAHNSHIGNIANIVNTSAAGAMLSLRNVKNFAVGYGQWLALAAILFLGLLLSPTWGIRKLASAKPLSLSNSPQKSSQRMSNWRTRLSRWSIPMPVWYAVRMFSVGIAFGLIVVLFVHPATGLFIFWRLFIPLLPLLFFVAPGLWRNICPMAVLNQTPRLFNFTRGLTLPKWMQEYGYVIAISLFLILVSSRKVIFNQNGPALALLMICALSMAFIMGNFFKGKSGWCSSICPLLPIQRIYGQTPFVNVTNAHCQPCVGCTKNCYDLSPKMAYLADLYDENAQSAAYRKFFVGLFPGFILAFYSLPNPPAISIASMYGYFVLFSLVSLGTFFLVDSFAKATSNKITVLYGAAALNLYYWFNSLTLGSLLGTPAPDWFVWPLRTLVFGLTLVWIYRTYQKEPVFIELTVAPRTTIPAAATKNGTAQPATVGASSAQAAPAEIVVEAAGKRMVVEKNRTLLEVIEKNNLPIEAGCRMGLCGGADPVCIHEGLENLSKLGSEERTTLERLGLAPNTRMACMARVQGNVKIALKAEQPDIYRSSIVAGFKYDKAVERVVIVGNGIAGVTAADHVRRRHPKCEIHLIGRERHHLYNRMGITRLIYGRSAMQGLYLLPDKWYDDFNITCWLNTHVTKVDAQSRHVTLGTGETLNYDRLILTTGSDSFVPPIAGYGLTGSFVLRTAEDAMAIRAYVQAGHCRRAVVAGGGLLGLEAAYGLHKLGLAVTVLERSNSLLRRQLDERAGQFLREYLEKVGIHIVMEAETSAVSAGENSQADGRLQQVTLKDGRTLPCDLFLVAVGIRSQSTLAKSLGLTIKQGVVVNAQMQTSAPHIFAAGDVAEFDNKVYGLWPVAVSQAEVAAANAVAAAGAAVATYTESPPVTMLKVVGIDITSIGRIDAQTGANQELVIALEESSQHRYRKLIVADGKIVGAILLGYPLEAPGVTAAIKQQMNVTTHLTALQAGDWQVFSTLA